MSSPDRLPGISRGRILEPEVMDDSSEVEAYLDGVATAHLDRMDDTFVRGALRLLKPGRPARALDVGTGTGAIPVKMARRRPDIDIVGVDRSPTMLAEARRLARTERLGGRVSFKRADGRRLPFPDNSFDLLVSNSLLHHLPDPAPALDDMARVLRRGGKMFVRDLRRPASWMIERHIARHGRFYRGTMFKLFADSVRAAFTEAELREIVRRSRLGRRRARVRRQFQTYLLIEIG